MLYTQLAVCTANVSNAHGRLCVLLAIAIHTAGPNPNTNLGLPGIHLPIEYVCSYSAISAVDGSFRERLSSVF